MDWAQSSLAERLVRRIVAAAGVGWTCAAPSHRKLAWAEPLAAARPVPGEPGLHRGLPLGSALTAIAIPLLPALRLSHGLRGVKPAPPGLGSPDPAPGWAALGQGHQSLRLVASLGVLLGQGESFLGAHPGIYLADEGRGHESQNCALPISGALWGPRLLF